MGLAGVQVRAARAMLRWRLEELADKCGVSVRTLQRIESADGRGQASAPVLRQLRACLETYRVVFVEDERGAGVMWRWD